VIENLIAEMVAREGNHTPLTTELAAAYLRQAYATGYSQALEDAEPDPEIAHIAEREAWARLPV